MKVDVFMHSLKKAQSLESVIRYRLKRALIRHASEIDFVRIRLRDVNAVKGGVDKECKVILQSQSAGQLVIRASHDSPKGAFLLALKRLIPNLRKRLARKRTRGGSKPYLQSISSNYTARK